MRMRKAKWTRVDGNGGWFVWANNGEFTGWAGKSGRFTWSMNFKHRHQNGGATFGGGGRFYSLASAKAALAKLVPR
jgi:hypothetical protein